MSCLPNTSTFQNSDNLKDKNMCHSKSFNQSVYNVPVNCFSYKLIRWGKTKEVRRVYEILKGDYPLSYFHTVYIDFRALERVFIS